MVRANAGNNSLDYFHLLLEGQQAFRKAFYALQLLCCFHHFGNVRFFLCTL